MKGVHAPLLAPTVCLQPLRVSLSLGPLCSSHTELPVMLEILSPRAFALAVPFAWYAPLHSFHWLLLLLLVKCHLLKAFPDLSSRRFPTSIHVYSSSSVVSFMSNYFIHNLLIIILFYYILISVFFPLKMAPC